MQYSIMSSNIWIKLWETKTIWLIQFCECTGADQSTLFHNTGAEGRGITTNRLLELVDLIFPDVKDPCCIFIREEKSISKHTERSSYKGSKHYNKSSMLCTLGLTYCIRNTLFLHWFHFTFLQLTQCKTYKFYSVVFKNFHAKMKKCLCSLALSLWQVHYFTRFYNYAGIEGNRIPLPSMSSCW